MNFGKISPEECWAHQFELTGAEPEYEGRMYIEYRCKWCDTERLILKQGDTQSLAKKGIKFNEDV